MHKKNKVICKVLVHEFEKTSLTLLKDVCRDNNLVGLRVSSGKRAVGLEDVSIELDEVLSSNMDLGAIFLTEAADDRGITGLDLCLKIHEIRPELPIFLRRITAGDLPDEIQPCIAGCYENNNIHQLTDLLNEYICSSYYPAELVKGFQEISEKVFESLIPGVEVICDYPQLVKDQIIFGELFSLIPLESDWCRGYMMLQATENEIYDLIRSGRTSIHTSKPNWAEINSILSEATNLIWGKIRACYFSNIDALEDNRIQVPIIVNHAQKHISFGSTEPQLCFKYVLRDPERKFHNINLYQRLIFNLNWSPEKFAENDKLMEHFVEGGELELF